jgi:hypothetical protein
MRFDKNVDAVRNIEEADQEGEVALIKRTN